MYTLDHYFISQKHQLSIDSGDLVKYVVVSCKINLKCFSNLHIRDDKK